MAIRRKEEPDDNELPTPAPTTPLLTQIFVIGTVLLLGFVGNSYLDTLYESTEVEHRFDAYKEAIKDSRP